MSATVDTTITLPFPFRDTAGALVTGKVDSDFTKVAYLASNGATTATVTVAAIAGQSGRYGATFTPSATGLWAVEIECTHAGQTYRWSEDVEVVTAAQADPAAALAAATLTHVSPYDAITSTLTLVQGDDYLTANGTQQDWTNASWSALGLDGVGVTVAFTAIVAGIVVLTKAMTVVTATTVRLQLTTTETGALPLGEPCGRFEVNAVLAGGGKRKLVSGPLTVTN